MKISFVPQRRDDTLTVVKAGDVLTINGEDFDFSVIPPGATLPAAAVTSDFICGDVSRSEDGELELTLLLPHGPNPSEAVAFPAPLLDPEDGPLPLPTDSLPEAAE